MFRDSLSHSDMNRSFINDARKKTLAIIYVNVHMFKMINSLNTPGQGFVTRVANVFFCKIKQESRAYSFNSNLDFAANFFFELLFYFFPKLAFDLLNIRLRWLAWYFAIARANSGFELMVFLLFAKYKVKPALRAFETSSQKVLCLVIASV